MIHRCGMDAGRQDTGGYIREPEFPPSYREIHSSGLFDQSQVAVVHGDLNGSPVFHIASGYRLSKGGDGEQRLQQKAQEEYCYLHGCTSHIDDLFFWFIRLAWFLSPS
jgi:hypothetical protein